MNIPISCCVFAAATQVFDCAFHPVDIIETDWVYIDCDDCEVQSDFMFNHVINFSFRRIKKKKSGCFFTNGLKFCFVFSREARKRFTFRSSKTYQISIGPHTQTNSHIMRKVYTCTVECSCPSAYRWKLPIQGQRLHVPGHRRTRNGAGAFPPQRQHLSISIELLPQYHLLYVRHHSNAYDNSDIR